MKPVLLALPAALVLSACATTGDPNQRAKNGALIGAVVGGALGANSTSDNKFERGVIGAVIGGTVGGVVGNELDKQAGELRRDLDGDVGVVNTGSELRVTLPQDLLFATNSDRLRSDLVADLRVVAGSLQSYPNSTVVVVGHTDSTGEAGYNQDLSERRAATVAGVLRSEGVSSARLRTQGAGEAQPVASNATPSGRTQNRRVEIIIRPNAA